jgi:hypothetical protein
MEYEDKSKKRSSDRFCALPSAKYLMQGARGYIQLIEKRFIAGPAAAYPFADINAGENSLIEASKRRYWFLPFRLLRRCRGEALPLMKGPTMDLFPNLRPADSVIANIDSEEEALNLISRVHRSSSRSVSGECLSSSAIAPGGAPSISGHHVSDEANKIQNEVIRSDAVLDIQEEVEDYVDDDSVYESDDGNDSITEDDSLL